MPRAVRARLRQFAGRSIAVSFASNLRASRGQIFSGSRAARMTGGQEVHAATFIRRRRIILDSALSGRKSELARILIHELFHFVWVRLGNGVRRSYAGLLLLEAQARARGELGWSAEMRKQELAAQDGKLWREYACESFCDTAAWLYAGLQRHDEFTLSARFRRRRAVWFRQTFDRRVILT